MNALIGMNGLGVVSIIIGAAVLGVSVLCAIGAGLGMVVNGQIRREHETRESEALAEAITRKQYQPMPPPRPMSHRPMRELDFATMTSADIARAFDLAPGVPAPKPAGPDPIGGQISAHPTSAG